MILTGTQIASSKNSGDIKIEPYNEQNINPNSYDLTLAPKLLIYTDPIMDVKTKPTTYEINLSKDGYVLRPGELYLASTNEVIQADDLVGVVYGKSSLARLGLAAHCCAGFIDSGFSGNITLQLSVLKPLKIYPNIKIAQIAFTEVVGDIVKYSGKYQDSEGIAASKSSKDFNG